MKQSTTVNKSVKRRGDKKPRREFEEFGPGKKDLMLCPICSAVYFNKSWHHNLQNFKHGEHVSAVHLQKCPACIMWQNRQWEGEIRLSGVPKSAVEDVSHNILHYADDAYRRDPMDRVLDISYSGSELTVLTTENQLAQKLS